MARATKDVWETNKQDFPATLPIDLQLKFLLRYAMLAPSSRNSQPWRFEVEGNTVELFADPHVPQPVSDPDGREVYLSLGCALENLLVAAEHFGIGHDVSYFPKGTGSALVARMTAQAGGDPSPARAEITLDALFHRRNDNRRYRPTPLPDRVRQRLQACWVEPELRLDLTDDRFFQRWVDELTREADRMEFADPAFRKELAAWIGQGAFGTSRVLSRIGAMAISRLDLGEAVARQDHELVASAALLGLISARTDDHFAHVRAGQLFERVWLTATTMGVRIHPMSQTMRHPELRAAVAELVPESGWKPLHLFRLGYPREKAQGRHRTPRRPLGGSD
jgi:nitroreductase